MKPIVVLMVFTLLVSAGAVLSLQTGEDTSTLLVYSTAERMLSGDLDNVVTIPEVDTELAGFSPTWSVVGVGTTNQTLRNGELMPDGPVDDVRFWWADPASTTQAAIIDLRAADDTLAGEATSEAGLGFEPEMPFLALAVANPDTALTVELTDVDSLHDALINVMMAEGIDLAGVQVEGEFGRVQTTVAYHIPRTGLDLTGGYVGEDYFRFGDYAPAHWIMNGIYAADPDLQPVVSTPGRPVHLHGYQPDAMLGGHIAAAEAVDVTVTVYPLAAIRQELNDEPADAAA